MKYIVVDLDGTTFDDRHRREHIDHKDWDKYHSRCVDDKPFNDVATAVRMMSGLASILIVTGRPERYRKVTLDALCENDIPFDHLLMRPDDNYTAASFLKIVQLEEFFGSKEKLLKEVLFALEDSDYVVKAYREYGITCWQVRNGGY